jgi:inorganic phosphate transporter, PiT family
MLWRACDQQFQQRQSPRARTRGGHRLRWHPTRLAQASLLLKRSGKVFTMVWAPVETAALAATAVLAGATAANYAGKSGAMWWASGRATWPALALPVALGLLAGAALSLASATALLELLLRPWQTAAALLGPGDGLRALLAAAVVVVVASVCGWPLSTTHALIGAAAGVLGTRTGALQGELWAAIVLPLLLSPLLAWSCARALVRLHRGPPRVHERRRACLHFGTAMALAVSAGFNTAPKLAALGLVALASPGGGELADPASQAAQLQGLAVVLLLAVVLGAFAGGLVARRVAFGLVRLDERRAAQAALCAALLTLVGAQVGVPVSQTHLVCAAAAGAGGPRGWLVWRPVLLAWLATAPAAALLAAGLVISA